MRVVTKRLVCCCSATTKQYFTIRFNHLVFGIFNYKISSNLNWAVWNNSKFGYRLVFIRITHFSVFIGLF